MGTCYPASQVFGVCVCVCVMGGGVTLIKLTTTLIGLERLYWHNFENNGSLKELIIILE